MNSASYEKNTSTKHNKYVVNQKLEHVEDISFRELFGRIRVVFYKIRFVSFEIKNTTDTDRSASYIDLHLEIDSRGRLRRKLYDKRDDFNVPIVNFPFICSNFSTAPAYGVYISQMFKLNGIDAINKITKPRII
jgi:hypothetical protein